MRRYWKEHQLRRHSIKLFWHSETKARVANGIRYPSSPSRKRWILYIRRIDPFGIKANALSIPAWGVCSQEWNSKELTGARTSGGACGLIWCNAKNLTRVWHGTKFFERKWVIDTYTQVVHGCRQLVSWDVGLSPATSATLVFSCFHSTWAILATKGRLTSPLLNIRPSSLVGI